jgi:hypothetical protein
VGITGPELVASNFCRRTCTQRVGSVKCASFLPDNIGTMALHTGVLNYETDPKESNNVAKFYPEVIAKIKTIMTDGRIDSPYFTFGMPAPKRNVWVKKAKIRAEIYIVPR